jgi:hypothetical protein
MTTAKMDINRRAQQDLRYPAARFNEKGCLQGVGWRCPYAALVEPIIT